MNGNNIIVVVNLSLDSVLSHPNCILKLRQEDLQLFEFDLALLCLVEVEIVSLEGLLLIPCDTLPVVLGWRVFILNVNRLYRVFTKEYHRLHV
jgi:hypothetical protein